VTMGELSNDAREGRTEREKRSSGVLVAGNGTQDRAVGNRADEAAARSGQVQDEPITVN
jgi:hypothetical protein